MRRMSESCCFDALTYLLDIVVPRRFPPPCSQWPQKDQTQSARSISVAFVLSLQRHKGHREVYLRREEV